MEPKTLRLKAAGTALVPIHEKIAQGIRQFVGREHKEVEPGVFGFAPCDRIDEVPNRAEYREAVKVGDALAADDETAIACGLKVALLTPKSVAPRKAGES